MGEIKNTEPKTGENLLEGWTIVKLKDLCEKVKNKNTDGDIKVVFSNTASSGIVVQTQFFDKNIANKENLTSYYIVEPDDFVYNPRISSLAPCGPINRNNTGNLGVVSPLYTVFKLKSEVCNLNYLEYYFKSSCWYKYMHSIANYGARADRMNITDSAFFEMPIILPSLEEQKEIVSILSLWDKAIHLKKKLVNHKKEQKKELTDKLLTGRMRLNGFNEEWSEVRLDKIAKLGIGLVTTMTENYVEQGVPLIRNSDISPNRISKDLIKLDNQFAEKNAGRMLRMGDIVTVHTGDVGVSAVIEKELDGCLGFATLNTSITNNSYDPYFISYYFNSKKFINFALKMSTGDGRNNFNLKDFKNSKVPSISLEEQKAIVNVLTLFDKEMYLIEQELKDLKLQKKALMQQFLTGKIRIKL